ncbi:hypothetical protein VTO42DRAFT_5119 [Malbranchea cinnamomea]
MPVELRKRKAPAEPAQQPASKRRSSRSNAAASNKKAKDKIKASTTSPKTLAVGETIDFDAFQDEITLQDGTPTSLKALVSESNSGVVLFTYPRASTPGCTNQACLFRDNYESLTSTGLSIYGLSTDSPKANTNFQTKQKLPYPLLCDPAAKLIGAIGLKKMPKGTIRGVFAVDKTGKVLLIQPGSPAGTVDAVKKLVEGNS